MLNAVDMKWSSALDSSSGVVRMWVQILAGRGTCVREP